MSLSLFSSLSLSPSAPFEFALFAPLALALTAAAAPGAPSRLFGSDRGFKFEFEVEFEVEFGFELATTSAPVNGGGDDDDDDDDDDQEDKEAAAEAVTKSASATRPWRDRGVVLMRQSRT